MPETEAEKPAKPIYGELKEIAPELADQIPDVGVENLGLNGFGEYIWSWLDDRGRMGDARIATVKVNTEINKYSEKVKKIVSDVKSETSGKIDAELNYAGDKLNLDEPVRVTSCEIKEKLGQVSE